MADKIHTNNKPKIKNLKISAEIHAKLKSYCNKNGLKIFAFIEKLIQENCKTISNEKNIYDED